MLIIDTELRPSSIHGIGLFTKQPLRKGQIIWVMHRNLDGCLTKDEWSSLPLPAKNYLHTYMYWSSKLNKYVACLDNSRHMNHSESPNTMSVYFASRGDIPKEMVEFTPFTGEQWSAIEFDEGFVISINDIAAGEELSCNYNQDFPDLGGASTLEFLKL